MTSKLTTLFDMVCDDFVRLLKDQKLSTADRKLLLEFLKDNDVQTHGPANKSITSILDNLPFDERITDGRVINH